MNITRSTMTTDGYRACSLIPYAIVVAILVGLTLIVPPAISAPRLKGGVEKREEIKSSCSEFLSDPRVKGKSGIIRTGPYTAQGRRTWCRDYPEWGWITLGLTATTCCYFVPDKPITTPPILLPRHPRNDTRRRPPSNSDICRKSPQSYQCLLGGANKRERAPSGGSSRRRPPGRCLVAVVFEPLSVQTFIGPTNYYHAVVIIGNTAFEANPSGDFRNWGHLVGRQRNLRRNPLKSGYIRLQAGETGLSCKEAVRRVRASAARVNSARLPYSPSPEVTMNGTVNSNSFAHYLVRTLGLKPPALNPITQGQVPGYNAAIQNTEP